MSVATSSRPVPTTQNPLAAFGNPSHSHNLPPTHPQQSTSQQATQSIAAPHSAHPQITQQLQSPTITITSSSQSRSIAASSPIPTSVSSSISIFDKPLPLLPRQQKEVSFSAFAWLFSEIVQYCRHRADSVTEIESKLSDLGYTIGVRYLDLSLIRASTAPILHISAAQRPRTILSLLTHIHGSLWRQLFNKVGDGLEKSTENDDEYYIYDHTPITSRYLSIPRDMGSLNCAAFIAGIIAGVCDAAGFACEVSAHYNANNPASNTNIGGRTVYVIKFEKEVIKRENTLTA